MYFNDPYLIVCAGPAALAVESTDSMLVYTRDTSQALQFKTRKLAEQSPWFCLGDWAMQRSEFIKLLRSGDNHV